MNEVDYNTLAIWWDSEASDIVKRINVDGIKPTEEELKYLASKGLPIKTIAKLKLWEPSIENIKLRIEMKL